MVMTGTNTDYDDLDITTDLADGVDGNSVPQGSQNATNTADGEVITERTQREIKPANTSLRDQLSNAFKGTADTAEGQEPEATTSISTAPTLTADAEGRYRRSDGTFASADEVLAFTEATKQATATPVDSIVAQLPAAVAEQFKSLPAEMQQFVARTMEDINGKATRYSEYDQLETIIGPRRDAWAQNGMNPLVAVSNLLQLSDFAGTKPGDFILWFAENNRIDLDQLLDERDAAQEQVNPEVLELRNQVQQMSQSIAQLRQSNTPDPQNENLNLVRNFALEKDEAGNLKRPYLTDVTPILQAHVGAVRETFPNMAAAEVLAKAYENACWASPEVRAKLQADMDKARRAAAMQKNANAKNASSTIRGGPSGSGGSEAVNLGGEMSLRDTLKYAFAQQS